MEVKIDDNLKEVLKLLRGYEIEEATLTRTGDELKIVEANPSLTASVKADLTWSQKTEVGDDLEKKLGEFKGSTTSKSINEREKTKEKRVGIDTERLYSAVRSYGYSEPTMRVEDTHLVLSGYNDRITLHTVKPEVKEPPTPEIDHTHEATARNIPRQVNRVKKVFGEKSFKAMLTERDETLYLEYGKLNSLDGLQVAVGELVNGSEELKVSFSSEYLSPLKGRWKLHLATDCPLKAERHLRVPEYQSGWETDLEVIVAPRID